MKNMKYKFGVLIVIAGAFLPNLKSEIVSDSTKIIFRSPPTFENEYIKLGTKGWLACGSFTIEPKSGINSVKLESYKWQYVQDPYTRTVELNKNLIGNAELTSKRQFRYDSAGMTTSHYRIFCKVNDKSVKCSDVVNIKSITHDKDCGKSSEVGISVAEGYKDLNMNKALK